MNTILNKKLKQTQNKNPSNDNRKAGEEEEEGLEKSNTNISKPGPLSSKIRMIECKKVQVSLKKKTGLPGPSKSTSRDVSPAEDVEEDIECLEDREEPLPKKRKRGRPVTTGDYERLKARRTEEQERREEEEEREILDPSAPLTNSLAWSRLENRVAEYLDDMREASLVDITAQTLDCATILKKIAVRFKYMKGTVKKEIADAACLMQAALHTLAMRAPVLDTNAGPKDEETEMEALKREIRELREDNIRLQGELRTHLEMGKKKAPRTLLSEETSARREKKEEGKTLHLPTEEIGMEVDLPQGVPPAPEPIMRPPIKGVQKRLQIDYPIGVESEESRKAYDHITDGIEKLLVKRSQLANSSSQPSLAQELSPIRDPQPAAALTNAKAVVPARSERGRKDVSRGKMAPKGTPNLGKKKEKGKAGPINTIKDRKMASSEPTSLAPQAPSSTQETSWAKMVGRKERKKGGPAITSQTINPPPVKSSGSKKTSPPLAQREKGRAQQSTGPGTKARKAPRTAAVTITCPEGQYAETISLARQKINLSELGIENVRARKAATGALVYEIPGENKKEKADLFARRLQEVLQDKEGVRVARPSKKGELRVRGLDESATKEEVVAEIARIGGCDASEVKAGEMRILPKTMGTLWVQCPLQAANKMAAAGKITVGWVTARVEALKPRPLQCHKCLEKGHVREKCTSVVDRSGACYNCGAPGHRANGCTAKTRCPLCAEAGLPADHRVGSEKCHPKRRRGGKTKDTEKSPENPPQKVARKERRKGGSPPQSESAVPERTELPKPQRDPRGKGTPQEREEEESTNEVPIADLIQLEEVVMEEA